MALPERKPSVTGYPTPSSYTTSMPRELTNHGTADIDEVMAHYKEFISKRMMPLGSRFKLSEVGHEDVIVLQSRSCPPVSTAAFP
jgi:hypothetical protein